MMSDIVKWGLLVIGFISIIALIIALPISNVLPLATTSLSEGIRYVVKYGAEGLYQARALINTFLMGYGIKLLSALMMWLVLK